MSIRSNGYYENIIPAASDYTIIYNLKVPFQSDMSRVLLIDYNSINVFPLQPPYIRFISNGSRLEIRCNTGLTGGIETGATFDSTRLNYIILSVSYSENKIYFWNPDTLTVEWEYPAPTLNQLGNVVHLGYGVATDADLYGAQLPHIHYLQILNKLVDIDDVKSIVAGVPPLENLNLLKNIHFLQDYRYGYGANSTLGIGIKQLGSYSFLYNPDRGFKSKIKHEISFRQSSSYLYNNTVNLNNIIIVSQAINVPIERTFQLINYLDLQGAWDLVDKYIVASNDLTFTTSAYMGFERTFEIATNVEFFQILKNWDGKISNTLTFTTDISSSLRVFDVNNDITIDYSEIGHNIKLDNWSDSCYTVCDVGLVEYEDYDVDNSNQGFIIVEEITISKDITRNTSNSITFNNIMDAYIVKQTNLENYG